MKRFDHRLGFTWLLVLAAAVLLYFRPAVADPSKYPDFAQQAMPDGVTPSFIFLDQLVDEIRAGKKLLIIDVRSTEEYREAHILGSLSVPLGEMNLYLSIIPKDRPLVLY